MRWYIVKCGTDFIEKIYLILVFTLASSFFSLERSDGSFSSSRSLRRPHKGQIHPHLFQSLLYPTHQAMQHLVENGPQGPPIHCPIIRLFTKHFWSQVLLRRNTLI